MYDEDNIVINEINKLKKEKNNLILKCEGIRLEYEYVNCLKDRKIEELKEKVKQQETECMHYKKRIEEEVEKSEKYKKELKQIKDSRLWKIRNILKGEK